MTLNQALESVMQLPIDEQEMLVDIVQRRWVAYRRQQIAEHAQASLAEYKAGQIKSQSAESAIGDLRALPVECA